MKTSRDNNKFSILIPKKPYITFYLGQEKAQGNLITGSNIRFYLFMFCKPRAFDIVEQESSFFVLRKVKRIL